MSKRSIKSDFRSVKRFKNSDASSSDEKSLGKLPDDAEATLLYLRSKFPVNNGSFPPIYFVHQLYSIIKNKTKVDREIGLLKNEGKILTYKLRADHDDVALTVAFTNEMSDFILKRSQTKTVQNFVNNILPKIKAVSIDRETLKRRYALTENHINELVQENLLVIKDVGNFWLSFPGAGEFIKTYMFGRKSVLRMVSKAKYSELLESELVKRKLNKKAILGLDYHIHDIIGSEAVRSISTTCGNLLRINS